MEGYQFAHVEVYSRQGSPGRSEGAAAGRRQNGDRAWSTAEILAEAERQRDASRHVRTRGLVPQILPGAVASFDALRAAHDAASQVKSSHIRTTKAGKKSKITRKLRSDAASLYTCVVSLPVLSADALADPDLMGRCDAVMARAMEVEGARIAALGGVMMMGVVHLDEDRVHVHLYALDPVLGRVDHLHPGRAAKQAVEKGATPGLPRADVQKEANRAYCDAMRDWQDDMHEAVFRQAGLMRFGPRRERLSRAEYLAAKRAAAERTRDADAKRELDRRQARNRETAELILASSKAQEAIAREEWAALEAERAAQQATAAALAERVREATRVAVEQAAARAAIAGEEAELERRQSKLHKREAEVQAAREAAARKAADLDAGTAMIEAMAAGYIEVAETPDGPRIRGRSSREADPVWRALRDRIRPGMSFATEVAHRVGRGLTGLRDRAQAEGLAQAREEAREEVRSLRERMESAVAAAGRVVSVAKRFARLLPGGTGEQMSREIDAAAMDMARETTVAKREERTVGQRQAAARRVGERDQGDR